MAAPHKIKDRITMWSRKSASKDTPERVAKRFSKAYVYTHVHSSIVHNSQNVLGTQVHADR
jgi:hypothetical protein